MDANGYLAQSPHPQSLGSALTNPYITTDFSEAQIEYTTLPKPCQQNLRKELEVLCHFVRLKLEPDREILWPLSMPARLPQEAKDIPIARYGTSSLGEQKYIYRRGLAHRYGSKMQTISGLHYNFSPSQNFWQAYFEGLNTSVSPANISEAYLGGIRNFLRYSYVFPYLFGDSPTIDRSFLSPEKSQQGLGYSYLQAWPHDIKNSLYGPYATSLRQSEIGYNHPSQWDLEIRYNSLEEYLRDMSHAVSLDYPAYLHWSQKEQLSQARLQIENEHYACIRPKQSRRQATERPLVAIQKHGIEYLEVRCIDIQSAACCGIDQASLRFTQLLLYYCMIEDSPPLNMRTREHQQVQDNYLKAIWEGRHPNCKIDQPSGPSLLREQGLELCKQLQPLAERLDQEENQICGTNQQAKQVSYQTSISLQEEKFRHPETIPSAKTLASMIEQKIGHLDFGLGQAKKHQENISQLAQADKERLEKLAVDSLKQQQQLEDRQAPGLDLRTLPILSSAVSSHSL